MTVWSKIPKIAQLTAQGSLALGTLLGAACSSSNDTPAQYTLTLPRRVDAAGQENGAWKTLASVYAEILPEAGTESRRLREVYSELTVAIRIRHLSGFTTKDRILFGSRIFDILSIENRAERNRELLIAAKERV